MAPFSPGTFGEQLDAPLAPVTALASARHCSSLGSAACAVVTDPATTSSRTATHAALNLVRPTRMLGLRSPRVTLNAGRRSCQGVGRGRAAIVPRSMRRSLAALAVALALG